MNEFIKRLDKKEARIGIVGLGYVGLPLLIEFAKAGFKIRGFDIDIKKINQLNDGKSYIRHIKSESITSYIAGNSLADLTTDFSKCSECDALLICVPTPLTKHREPDLSYITGTAHQLSPHLVKGQLIVLESTTYPGTTEDVLVPILEQSGLKSGIDFFVAYSPEREDPNNNKYTTSTIPKVIGGLNEESLRVTRALYGKVIKETVPVSSCRVAEATKLMENIFRCVNIALVNELKVVFTEMGIDVWEVINAAKTKPFGYTAFYPGPGLGGHCIPIDPFYLTWKAKEYELQTRFIELAGEINSRMPDYVIERTMLALNENRKTVNGSSILLVGLAYKKNVDDMRESPTFIIWKKLISLGARVDYFDPYCPIVPQTREHPEFAGIKSKTREDLLSDSQYDAAIITTDHDNLNYTQLLANLPLVLDTRNVDIEHDNLYHG